MSQFYDDLAQTALELLAEFGLEVTLVKKGVNVADPTTGRVTKGTPTSETRVGVVTDNPGDRIGEQYGSNFKGGTLTKQTGKWLYMDANGQAPAVEDEIVMQGFKYQLVDVQTIGPGGQALLYLLVMHR